MKLSAATVASFLLSAGSCLLLWWADEATDVAAVAAGTGLVVAGALLGLTLLAWRWRRGGVAYTTADVVLDTDADPAIAFERVAQDPVPMGAEAHAAAN